MAHRSSRGPDSATGIKVDERSALTSNAVWACVRILSETIAALPLHVYRNLPDGGKAKAPEISGLRPAARPAQPRDDHDGVERGGHRLLALWGNSGLGWSCSRS